MILNRIAGIIIILAVRKAECVKAKYISLDVPPLRATMILWAGITGIITMAHKKEVYINMAMDVAKEDFMRDGFRMLLKSITGKAQ